MKRVRKIGKSGGLLLLVLIILLLSGCTLFSGLRKEAKEYPASVFSVQIEVSTPRQINGVEARINSLAFKRDFKPGKSFNY